MRKRQATPEGRVILPWTRVLGWNNVFARSLLLVSQGPGRLCLVRHPTVGRIKLGEMDLASDEGQIFKIERRCTGLIISGHLKQQT